MKSLSTLYFLTQIIECEIFARELSTTLDSAWLNMISMHELNTVLLINHSVIVHPNLKIIIFNLAGGHKYYVTFFQVVSSQLYSIHFPARERSIFL